MRHSHLLLILIFAVSFLSGCATSAQLKVHRLELQRLAYGGVSNIDKFDGLASVLVTVLDESTDFSSPFKTYRYISKFVDQNDDAIKVIVSDLESWQNNMSQTDRIQFTARAVTKPYSRKLMTLVPKVQKIVEEGGYSLGPLEKALIMFKLKSMIRN